MILWCLDALFHLWKCMWSKYYNHTLCIQLILQLPDHSVWLKVVTIHFICSVHCVRHVNGWYSVHAPLVQIRKNPARIPPSALACYTAGTKIQQNRSGLLAYARSTTYANKTPSYLDLLIINIGCLISISLPQPLHSPNIKLHTMFKV